MGINPRARGPRPFGCGRAWWEVGGSTHAPPWWVPAAGAAWRRGDRAHPLQGLVFGPSVGSSSVSKCCHLRGASACPKWGIPAGCCLLCETWHLKLPWRAPCAHVFAEHGSLFLRVHTPRPWVTRVRDVMLLEVVLGVRVQCVNPGVAQCCTSSASFNL